MSQQLMTSYQQKMMQIPISLSCTLWLVLIGKCWFGNTLSLGGLYGTSYVN